MPVLMYHRVGDIESAAEAKYCVTPQRFAAQMRRLAAAGWRSVPIDALAAWLDGGPAPREGDFVLSFDDGFEGVLHHAAPVLEALGWPYTVFVVSGRIGRSDDWNHHDGSQRRHRLLDAGQLAELARRGCSLHSHTRSHASLPGLDDARLMEELAGSRQDLQALLGAAPRYLAYPYGHHDERVVAAARAAGYGAAFSVQPGFNRQDVDRYRVRRLDVFGTDTPAQLLRKLRLGSNDGRFGSAVAYYARRLGERLIGARA
ncbi:polysaccharide deacetylase family protein [Rubrivivax gelatinosus]|uniref:Polysaccharide deacetylase n=1 Tax=Rubrivivax gelatinosus TaxID=28068 RepID=A0A4R2MFD6_RUBGE|nr:polysaccharide deacetylase family protein [Rubrivivax gelatinosus]TCP05592.1 polysaccharide deacetylase [Rubrivivax gelatinosus]